MKTEVVNLRLTESQKAAIDYAAGLANQTRTEYMVRAALDKAENDRYDQVRFVLPKQDFDYLRNQVSNTGSEIVALDGLLAVELPWEK